MKFHFFWVKIIYEKVFGVCFWRCLDVYRVQFECLQRISVGFPTPSFQRAFCVSSFWRGYYLYHPKQCMCFKMEIAQSDHRLCKCFIFFKMGDSMTHVFVRICLFFLVKSYRANYYIYILFLHLNWGHSLEIGLVCPENHLLRTSRGPAACLGGPSKTCTHTNMTSSLIEEWSETWRHQLHTQTIHGTGYGIDVHCFEHFPTHIANPNLKRIRSADVHGEFLW